MALYTFFQHKAMGEVPAFDLEDLASDQEARLHACWMLKDDPLNAAIDVWGDVGFVARKPCVRTGQGSDLGA